MQKKKHYGNAEIYNIVLTLYRPPDLCFRLLTLNRFLNSKDEIFNSCVDIASKWTSAIVIKKKQKLDTIQ